MLCGAKWGGDVRKLSDEAVVLLFPASDAGLLVVVRSLERGPSRGRHDGPSEGVSVDVHRLIQRRARLSSVSGVMD